MDKQLVSTAKAVTRLARMRILTTREWLQYMTALECHLKKGEGWSFAELWEQSED